MVDGSAFRHTIYRVEVFLLHGAEMCQRVFWGVEKSWLLSPSDYFSVTTKNGGKFIRTKRDPREFGDTSTHTQTHTS